MMEKTLAAAKPDTCVCVSLHLHKCSPTHPQASTLHSQLSTLHFPKASLYTQNQADLLAGENLLGGAVARIQQSLIQKCVPT